MTEFLPTLLTTGVILENGGTDAPNAVSTCVASGVLTPRKAAFLASAFNFLGAAVSGLFFPRVAATVAELSGLSGCNNMYAALTAAMLAVLLWTGAAWLFSIPTSESHALLAALGGSALGTGGSNSIDLLHWSAILAATFGTVAAGWLFGRFFRRILSRFTVGEKTLGRSQLIFAAIAALLHGAQDGQKFMCVLALANSVSQGANAPDSLTIPVFTVLWCSAVLAVGTALCGKKMLGVAGKLGVESRLQGLSADIGGSAVLLASTLAGIPVSTTHVKTASAAGAGDFSQNQRRTFLRLGLAWILTFPSCALLGWALVPLMKLLF